MFALFFIRNKDTQLYNLEIHSICQLTNKIGPDLANECLLNAGN